ncbi:MAG: diacylglycerol kinase family protein [Deferribacterota bacterium]|nr:diacylglycerol kinase family protein [Deferribacterota bacterium]
MIKNICIVTNLKAGNKNYSKAYYENIIQDFNKKISQSIEHIVLQDIPNKYDLLDHVKKADMLVINGGDGTVQNILTLLCKNIKIDEIPLIAILPVGSTNLIALDVGAIKSKKNVLKKFIERFNQGETQINIEKRALVHIKNEETLIDEYGFFIGLAQFYKSSVLFNEKLRKYKLAGPIGIIIVTIYNFYCIFIKNKFDKNSDEVIIKINSKIYSFTPFLLCITTLKKIFTKKTIITQENTNNKHIFLLIVKNKAKHIIRNMYSFFTGKKSKYFNEKDGFMVIHNKNIELSGADGIAIDGELFKIDKTKDKLYFERGPLISFVVLN